MNKNLIFAFRFILVLLFVLFVQSNFVTAQTSTVIPAPTSTTGPTVSASTPTPSILPTIPVSITPTPTSAAAVKGEQQNRLQEQIKEYESKINDLQGQAKTLSSQISIMDSQIRLTELRVYDSEQKIRDINADIDITKNKITQLETEIDLSTKVLLNRIVAVYEVGRVNPWHIFLTSDNISNFFTRLTYLRIVQANDKRSVYASEQAKVNYENQKNILVEKQKELELLKQKLQGYKAQLDNEKAAKQELLNVTKNDEKKYQNLLAMARSEYEAIQGIVTGKGDETLAGHVNQGERIASIIQGGSCNSNGTHLHFIINKNDSNQNPFSYLRGGIDYENCSGSSCGSSDGDSFNPSGDWDWPIEPKITMAQGYGSTWAVRYSWVGRIYSFHNGIDINSPSSAIKAIKNGTLYRGSYGGSGGCRLRYVKITHDEGGYSTYYLHINY